MSNEKKNRTIAAIGTILVHALVLLVLFLMAFRTPLPLPGEEGVEVDLGMYNQGMGLIQPDQPAIPEPATPPAPPRRSTSEPSSKVPANPKTEAPKASPDNRATRATPTA